jgi:uncharacterized protein YdhG (YjbR/CyaY superfamily)
MKIEATTIEEYISLLPEERQAPIQMLRKVIKKNLPKGFVEEMNYNMIGYVVPHKTYPSGYHCDPKMPLPFMNIASQKNFIAVYNMGVYVKPELVEWFTKSYEALKIGKLDMGKSCIRFKKPDLIPYDLIGELATKFTPKEWIEVYENLYKSK